MERRGLGGGTLFSILLGVDLLVDVGIRRGGWGGSLIVLDVLMDDCVLHLFGLATPDCAEGNDTENPHHSQQNAETTA